MYDPLAGGYSKDDFQRFIESNNVASLAVLSPDWGVQVTAVFYAVESDMSVLIKSHTTSNHGKELIVNNKVALSIYDPKSTYTVKAGVQLRGACERILDREEMENAVAVYSKAFPGADKRFAPIDELISADAKSTLFRIKIVSGKMLTPDGFSPEFQVFG